MKYSDFKTARTRLGLSLRDLAELTGVSAATLSRLERSQENISHNYVLAVAKALGIDDIQKIRTIDILEKELIMAWQHRDFALILEMIVTAMNED